MPRKRHQLCNPRPGGRSASYSECAPINKRVSPVAAVDTVAVSGRERGSRSSRNFLENRRRSRVLCSRVTWDATNCGSASAYAAPGCASAHSDASIFRSSCDSQDHYLSPLVSSATGRFSATRRVFASDERSNLEITIEDSSRRRWTESPAARLLRHEAIER